MGLLRSKTVVTSSTLTSYCFTFFTTRCDAWGVRMTENELERSQQQPAGDQDQAKAKLLDDTRLENFIGNKDTANSSADKLSGINSTAAGRVAYVTGEGLAKAPQGVWNGVLYQFDNPDQFAMTAGTGALFGVGMRLLLPRAGAARALVGTAMSYFFIKDAAKPILTGWSDAANASTMTELQGASTKMGDGLGTFAVNTGIGLVTGVAAEGVTGAALNRFAGGRRFEAWKEHQFNSENTFIGRQFKRSERIADNTSDAVAATLLGKGRNAGDELTVAQKIEAIKLSQKQSVVEADGSVSVPIGPRGERVNIGHQLGREKAYRSQSFSERIDNLLAGRAENAPPEGPIPGPGSNPVVRRIRADDRPPKEGPTVPGQKAPTETKAPGEGGKPPTDGTPPSTKDGAIIITDAAAAPPVQPRVGDMNAPNVQDMAVAMRTATSRRTKEDMAVAQATEDIAGPLSSTMRSGKAPLDAPHFQNNEMLLALNGQIRTADEYRGAGFLLDHFRTANQQLEIAARGSKGGLDAVNDLNQMSRSVHAQMLKKLDDNGIPRSVVRGSNSPLFTIRDSDGAGPYTIPAIKDPVTGKPVTDAAVVTYPREYQRLEGVHTSGVYPHELGHDLIYGDLLKFPQNVRDNILTDKVVGDAMRARGIADVDMPVPGAPGGVMKKSEFFVQMLKAQANENTADMFGTSIDPNTGLSLALLLSSLRKPAGNNPAGPGLLETRSVYGKDMIDPAMHNNLGIAVHGIDRFRIKLSAETLRELGDGDAPINAYAAKLDVLADTMSRPGKDYIWANSDQPGQFISVAQAEVDALIPALVKAQFNTKLDALNGHPLRDIAPKMTEVFPRVDALSEAMADAAIRGNPTVPGFAKTGYKIEDVFSAGLSGWMKAVQKNADSNGTLSAEILMTRINQISESLRAQYRNDTPETILTASKPISAKLADVAVMPFSAMARATGRAAEYQPRLRDRVAGWTVPLTSYAGGQYFGPGLENSIKDLMDTQAVQNQMLDTPAAPGDAPKK